MPINGLNNNIFSKKNLTQQKSIQEIKQEFFEYLEEQDKTGKIDAAELMTSDVSIFMYAGEFQKFLSSEGSKLGIGDDFSGSFSDILEMEFDEDNEELVAGKNASDEDKTLVGMINDLFKNEDVKKSSDIDGDGKLSQEEMTNFLQLMNEFDKNSDNLSIKDFFGAIEGIENGTFNPSYGIIPMSVDNPEVLAMQQQLSADAAGAGGVSGGDGAAATPSNSTNPVYGSNGVPATPLQTKASSTETSDNQAKDIQEIDKQIAEKNNEITNLNSEKAQAYGDNQEYQTLTKDLNEATKAISTANANITNLETTLHQTQTEISSKQSELDNLQDPLVFTEYKEEIEKRRNELQSALTELKTKEQDTQKQIDDEKQTVTENEQKKTNLEQQISEFEKNNPNDKVNEINQKISTLKSEISSLEQQKQQKETEIKQTRDQEKSDAEVYGKMTAYRQSEFVKYIMDLATSDATANKYNNAGFKGAWCAVFTSDMTEALLAEVNKRVGGITGNGQGLNGSQMAMHAVAWGNAVQSALQNAGINKNANVNISNMTEQQRKDAVRNGLIYPGMTFEYEANGGYHTGFIESINPDLTWNTIEGNSTGGKVGANRRDATNNRLTTTTDSVLNAWYLARNIYAKNGRDINNAIFHL